MRVTGGEECIGGGIGNQVQLQQVEGWAALPGAGKQKQDLHCAALPSDHKPMPACSPLASPMPSMAVMAIVHSSGPAPNPAHPTPSVGCRRPWQPRRRPVGSRALADPMLRATQWIDPPKTFGSSWGQEQEHQELEILSGSARSAPTLLRIHPRPRLLVHHPAQDASRTRPSPDRPPGPGARQCRMCFFCFLSISSRSSRLPLAALCFQFARCCFAC